MLQSEILVDYTEGLLCQENSMRHPSVILAIRIAYCLSTVIAATLYLIKMFIIGLLKWNVLCLFCFVLFWFFFFLQKPANIVEIIEIYDPSYRLYFSLIPPFRNLKKKLSPLICSLHQNIYERSLISLYWLSGLVLCMGLERPMSCSWTSMCPPPRTYVGLHNDVGQSHNASVTLK